MSIHEGPRSARVIIEREGRRRRLCRVSWSVQDASLFVAPFSGASEYFGGAQPMAAGEDSIKIPFGIGPSFSKAPKLSIHESGQLHVRAPSGDIIGGPIHLEHLKRWRGQQVLTIAIDDIDHLPLHEAEPRFEGTDQDMVLQLAERNTRVAVYANSERQRFDDPTEAAIALSRGSLGSVLWVGLALFPNEVLAEGSVGVSIVAGVDPTDPGAEGQLLYVRGQ